MTYIYDILLNFTDENRIIEFFEWDENDVLDHIKKIPVFRVSSKQIAELLNNEVKVEKTFLNKIKSQTITYNRTKNLEYAALITDINKVIAIEFNNNGEIISRSTLLLDEEEDIIDECFQIKQELIPYKIVKTINIEKFLSRKEIKIQKYLLKEFKNLYETKNIDKLTYLYEELYKKDNLSFKEMYLKLKESIENDYSEKHTQLYEIVRLSYTKNRL